MPILKSQPFVVGPSRATKWTQIIIGATLTGAFSPLGADAVWRHAASLVWLHHALPWLALSALFAVYTVLLLRGTTTALLTGNGLGVVLFLLETFALIATGFKPQNPGNPMVVAGMVLAVVLHARAVSVAAAMAAKKVPTPPDEA